MVRRIGNTHAGCFDELALELLNAQQVVEQFGIVLAGTCVER
jgi:hypothetical protein